MKNLRVTFTAEGSEFVLLTSDEDFSNILNKLRIDTVKFLNGQNVAVTSYLAFEEIQDWKVEVIDPHNDETNVIHVYDWRV